MIEAIFWGSGVLIVYAYLGYPAALALLSLRRSRRVARAAIRPRVSFIIAAYNEEAGIRAKLENTLAQRYPATALEVIVASDCSTDGTDAIVERYAPRVTLVRAPERKGKEAAQQVAVAAATGEVLIFSDVGTRLDADAVATIVENFADPGVGCVSSIDRFVDADGRVSGEGAYVRYEMRLRSLESRVHSLVGLSGSFFAARRDVCARWSADCQSDFNTLLNAVRMGLRGVLDERAAGYYHDLSDERREMQRKIRTVVRGLHVLAANRRMLNPRQYGLFAWQLASHKLCRWLVPFAMLAAIAANAGLAWGSPGYQVLLAGQALFYAAAAAGAATGAPSLRLPAYLVVVNAGVLLAWIRYARGERIAAWTPSARVRFGPASGPQ